MVTHIDKPTPSVATSFYQRSITSFYTVQSTTVVLHTLFDKNSSLTLNSTSAESYDIAKTSLMAYPQILRNSSRVAVIPDIAN